MGVHINQARHDHATSSIDHPGLRACQGLDISVAAHRRDLPVPDCNGLRPWLILIKGLPSATTNDHISGPTAGSNKFKGRK
jgi:hypothetical protein